MLLPALVTALLTALVSAACSVALVSDYDPHIDETATLLQRGMDGFLTHLEANPDAAEAAYELHADFYREYLVDLRALEVRAAAHPDNDITLRQVALLRDNLEQLRATHEAQDRISPASAATFRELFNTAWRAVIEWELAKKRGAPRRPAPR